MKELINFHDYPIKDVLEILLKDRTTKKNIVFATNEYAKDNSDISAKSQITLGLIKNNEINIEPRVQKSLESQEERTRKKAEVFTPSWICNKMNNHCDTEWFGRENVFNIEDGQDWITEKNKIKFDKTKSWQEYVKSKRLEITCGEAPYIVSRYDASTGEIIPIKDRIGILDRKLRIINEHTRKENTWFEWVKKAYQSVYGYEFQGDNLLLARSNLINTFVEYKLDRWNKEPTKEELKTISNIVSWNLWQMYGIQGNVPFGIPEDEEKQMNLLEVYDVIPSEVDCTIYDWDEKKIIPYKSLRK